MVKYKIVYPISETYVYLCRIVIVFAIPLAYFFVTRTEFYKRLAEKHNGLEIIFWSLLCVMCTFLMFILTTPKKLGAVIFTEDEIIVEINKNQSIYPLSLLTSIEITTDFLEENYGMRSGNYWSNKHRGASIRGIFTNNWFSFYYQNDFYSYQFEISSLFSQQQMLDMMEKWRIKNVNFIYS